MPNLKESLSGNWKAFLVYSLFYCSNTANPEYHILVYKLFDEVYERGILYQFKPLQRLHWTRRQAVLDADDIIAGSLVEGGVS